MNCRWSEELLQTRLALPRWLILIAVLLSSCGGREVLSDEEVASATERLRPKLSEVEMDDFIEACLEAQGVVSFVRQPGGNGFSGEQVTDRDQQVMESCQESMFNEYGYPVGPRTDADYLVLYRLYERETACLREIGLTVDIPSFETYREGNGAWAPYRDLPEPASYEEWEHWNTSCPQDPWAYETVDESG